MTALCQGYGLQAFGGNRFLLAVLIVMPFFSIVSPYLFKPAVILGNRPDRAPAAADGTLLFPFSTLPDGFLR